MVISLLPHPALTSGPAHGVTVRLARDGQFLGLCFVVEGPADHILWPQPVGDGRADDLWRHTCFEAFVQTDDGYVEFNLSPSERWASYRFDAPRAGMRPAGQAATVLGQERTRERAALEARIDLPPTALRLALSAVIEDVDGGLSYWALAHPSDKPDFHHPDSFVLDLP